MAAEYPQTPIDADLIGSKPREIILTRAEAGELLTLGIFEAPHPLADRIFEEGVAGIILSGGEARLVRENPQNAGEYEDLRKVGEEVEKLLDLGQWKRIIWGNPDEEE